MGILKQNLGRRLRELRKSRKFTQAQLSDVLKCDPKTISRIESGLNYPSFELLENIANSLNIEIMEFFNFKHLAQVKELKKELTADINSLDEKYITIAYKMIKSLTV